MPYINYLETDDNYNYYKPSESLQNLFENVVITPLRGSLPGVASNPNVIYDLSKTVLDQGRTNFDESYQDYTPQNKVLLYCVYYMPMHLYSSYHFYRHIPLIGINNVVFIDFGCGPLTSGVAFWAAAGERNITYIGIDRAQSMLTKACEINGYHPEFEGAFLSRCRILFDKRPTITNCLNKRLQVLPIASDVTQYSNVEFVEF